MGIHPNAAAIAHIDLDQPHDRSLVCRGCHRLLHEPWRFSNGSPRKVVGIIVHLDVAMPPPKLASC
jgi:hypothetical protein